MVGSTPMGWPVLSLFVIALVTVWLLPLLPLVVGAVAMSVGFGVTPLLSIIFLAPTLAMVRLPLAVELMLVATFAAALPVALVLRLVSKTLLFFGPLLALSVAFATALLVGPLRVEASVGLGGALGRDLGVHGLLQELVVGHDLP